jgi:hypothetical protein
MARERAKQVPPPIACTTRAARSAGIVSASAPISDPAMKSASAASTQGRRPMRSEIGPTMSCVIATARR